MPFTKEQQAVLTGNLVATSNQVKAPTIKLSPFETVTVQDRFISNYENVPTVGEYGQATADAWGSFGTVDPDARARELMHDHNKKVMQRAKVFRGGKTVLIARF